MHGHEHVQERLFFLMTWDTQHWVCESRCVQDSPQCCPKQYMKLNNDLRGQPIAELYLMLVDSLCIDVVLLLLQQG